MAIKDFQNLIEIQSLDKYIEKHLLQIKSNLERVTFLEKQRSAKEKTADELRLENQELASKMAAAEKELFEIEQKIEQSKEHKALAQNEKQVNAIQTTLDDLIPRSEALEVSILEQIEKQEKLDESISECEVFLKGSAETLIEIQSEVEAENIKEQKEIDNYQSRIDNLKTCSEKMYVQAFEQSNKSNRFKNPLCYVENKSCSGCRFQMDAVTAQNVEHANITELCTGCGRLITPLSARA